MRATPIGPSPASASAASPARTSWRPIASARGAPPSRAASGCSAGPSIGRRREGSRPSRCWQPGPRSPSASPTSARPPAPRAPAPPIRSSPPSWASSTRWCWRSSPSGPARGRGRLPGRALRAAHRRQARPLPIPRVRRHGARVPRPQAPGTARSGPPPPRRGRPDRAGPRRPPRARDGPAQPERALGGDQHDAREAHVGDGPLGHRPARHDRLLRRPRGADVPPLRPAPQRRRRRRARGDRSRALRHAPELRQRRDLARAEGRAPVRRGRSGEAREALRLLEAHLAGLPASRLSLGRARALAAVQISEGGFAGGSLARREAAERAMRASGAGSIAFDRTFLVEVELEATLGLLRREGLSSQARIRARTAATWLTERGVFDLACMGYRALALLDHAEGRPREASRALRRALSPLQREREPSPPLVPRRLPRGGARSPRDHAGPGGRGGRARRGGPLRASGGVKPSASPSSRRPPARNLPRPRRRERGRLETFRVPVVEGAEGLKPSAALSSRAPRKFLFLRDPKSMWPRAGTKTFSDFETQKGPPASPPCSRRRRCPREGDRGTGDGGRDERTSGGRQGRSGRRGGSSGTLPGDGGRGRERPRGALRGPSGTGSTRRRPAPAGEAGERGGRRDVGPGRTGSL